MLKMRVSGRVTTALLDPVKVALPDSAPVRLEELATVGVKDGSTLLITVFQENVCFFSFPHCTGKPCFSNFNVYAYQ